MSYHGAASDIWSCGVILFALLTGRLPFDDENIRVLLQKVKNGRYTVPADLPGDAKDLIDRMLVVDPEKRITVGFLSCSVPQSPRTMLMTDGGGHASPFLPAASRYRFWPQDQPRRAAKTGRDCPACTIGEGDR